MERRDCQTVAKRGGCLGDLRKKMCGQVIFNMLVEHGVDTVFGYSGGKSSQGMWDFVGFVELLSKLARQRRLERRF